MSQPTPLKYLAKINPVKSETNLQATDLVSFVPMDAVSENGGLRTDEDRELDDVYTGYTYFKEGDIVVAKITPCFENGKASIANGLTNGTGFGTTELHVLRPDNVDREYLFYLICSDRFRKVGESMMYGAGGQKRLPEQFIADYEVPVTDLPTQRAIARYLDARTARIDALIARKQRLLELLAERRAALITRAVTRGLDPAAPTYDSGVDWLGKIPVGWEVKRIKDVSSIRYGLGEPPAKLIGGVPFIRATDIYRGSVDMSKVQTVDPDEVPWHRRPKLQKGEILVVRSGAYTGDSAIISDEVADSGAVAGYDMVVNVDSAVPEYIAYSLLSKSVLENQIYLMRSRAAQPHLNAEELGSVLLVIPNLELQALLVNVLNNKLNQYQALYDKATHSIHHLQEYRSALITAAVNGEVELPQPD